MTPPSLKASVSTSYSSSHFVQRTSRVASVASMIRSSPPQERQRPSVGLMFIKFSFRCCESSARTKGACSAWAGGASCCKSWGRHMIAIALTGWGQEEDRRRSLEARHDHHLTKPVDRAALQKLLAVLALPAPAWTLLHAIRS